MFPDWYYSPQGSVNLQGSGPQLQGSGSSGVSLQGSAPKLQGSSPKLQVTANPMDFADPESNTNVLGANTSVDPAQAAAAQAAADAAKASRLRGQITDIANAIKDIFNSRYGQVDKSAAEQSGKLNDRFATESGDITQQVEGENQKLGAAHAASGSFDSSYRGNNVDTVTHAGENQIRDLGTELQDNIAKIAAWVSQQKAGFDANKGGINAILSHLDEETDPSNLSQIRGSLEQRIADLKAGNADNNTTAENAQALNKIAPTSVRAQQLKTTLSQIVAGNADASQKATIGARLIESAGLSGDEKKALLDGLNADIAASEKKVEPTQTTA